MKADSTPNYCDNVFSIVIPTCNRSQQLNSLLQTLAAIWKSSAPPFEVIVTDDGYGQNSGSRALDLPFNVQDVAGPGKGPAANRNNGARFAKGEWIIFIDDDCLAFPSLITAYGDAITSGVDVYEGKTICSDWVQSPLYEAPINLEGGYLWSCNMMIRKSLFESLGGFDERFPFPAMEDVDLRERLKDLEIPFIFVADAVVDHPKRRAKSANTLAMYRESVFYFNAKRNVKTSLVKGLIIPEFIWMLRQIKRSRNPAHWLIVVYRSASISLFLAIYYPGWVKKYVR